MLLLTSFATIGKTFGIRRRSGRLEYPNVYYTVFFPGQLAFCKKTVVGLTARRIFWIVQWSGVGWSCMEWSRVESCGVEKLDKSYTFVYFLTHFLLIINNVIRGAYDNWYTHVRYTEISKFDLLFFVYQYQYGHTRRAWYTHVRSMGIYNFNLLCRLMGVRIIDFNL